TFPTCRRRPRRPARPFWPAPPSRSSEGHQERVMIIRKQPPRPRALGEPILHENHKRPVTRREMLGAGLVTAPAVLMAPAWLGALLRSGTANALSNDIQGLAQGACGLIQGGGGKSLPFICFDLAGGANLVGSEVLVGVKG